MSNINNHEELYLAVGKIQGTVEAIQQDVTVVKENSTLNSSKIQTLETHVGSMQPHVEDYANNKQRIKGMGFAMTGLSFIFATFSAFMAFFGVHIDNPFGG